MTSDSWYIFRNEQRIGPVTEAQLLDFLANGSVLRSDLVWRPGLPRWTPAERLPEFAELRPPPLPPQAFAQQLTPPPLPKGFAAAPAGRDSFPNPGKAPRTEGYLARHWLGQLSLPVSFWFNGFLGYLVATIAVVLVGASSLLRTEFSPAIGLLSLIAVWAITFAVLGWHFVGTWRAATIYSINRTNVFWPVATKFFLCTAIALTLSQFAGRGFPQIQEMYGIYAGDEEVGKYAFRVLRDGRELEFSGGITYGASKEFERFMDTLGTLTTVHLNSDGGRIEEAQRIGDLIKKRSLDTYVASRCLSACTIVFLSGKRRFITQRATIGFHQPNAAALTDEERDEIIKKEELRLQGFGLSARFAQRANEASPNDMWVPTAQELIDEKVATQIVESSKFALSGLAESELTLEATDELLHNIPKYEAVAKMDGEAYRQIRSQVWDGLQKGKSAPEITSQIDPIVDGLFEKALPHTSAENLVEYAEMLVRHMRLLNRDNPGFCYAYINPDRDGAELPHEMGSKYPDLLGDQNAIKSKVLNSYQGNVTIELSQDAVRSAFDDVMNSVKKKAGQEAGLVGKENIGENEYSAYCNVMVSFYEEILRLPATTRTASLRTLFQ